MVANSLGFMLGCDAVNLIQQSTVTVANEIRNTRVGPWKVLNNQVLSSVQCWLVYLHKLSCYTPGEVTGYSNNTNIHNPQWQIFWRMWEQYLAEIRRDAMMRAVKSKQQSIPYGVTWSTKKTCVQNMLWDWREVERMDTTTKYESNKFDQGEQITFATATGEILPVNQNELL